MYLSRGERIFEVCNIIFLIFISLLFLVPFLSVLSTSLIGVEEWVRRGAFVLIPEKIDLAAYRMLLGSKSILFNAYGVTLLRVTIGTFLNLFFTITAAYVLARRNLPGRTLLTLIVFIPMVFSGGLIPTFIVVDAVGLVNSFWAMVIPGLINPWWLLIMRNFFMSIPQELEEAAIIDGANALDVLWRVVLPLSMPSIATIGLFYAVWHWNSWFDAAIYLKDQIQYPMQLILRSVLYLGEASYRGEIGQMFEPEFMPPAQTLKSAMIIVSTVPILLVYPFIQRYFVKGMLIGGIKG
ncbi:MAG TPA: carbohydrate ABC transporter permease [Caldilineaceae bacterium]|nr:carbohydrate ABC transporter permease [Caldilineaceae bacterium]